MSRALQLVYSYLFYAMWAAYVVYWWAMSRDTKASERTEAVPSRLLRLLLMICAVALLSWPRVPLAFLNRRFLPQPDGSFWCGAAITAAGLLFSVWGRRHLGRNWSRAVTVKQDHELITSGPYALVRHPIYTGLLTGFLGSAIARGQYRGLLAVLLLFVALWFKLQLEEQWMRAHFGEQYAAYSRRVAALVPYLL